MEYREAIKMKMAEEEQKAWESLSGYKFLMFGYHASNWVNYRKLLQEKVPNPFRGLVDEAQEIVKLWERVPSEAVSEASRLLEKELPGDKHRE